MLSCSLRIHIQALSRLLSVERILLAVHGANLAPEPHTKLPPTTSGIYQLSSPCGKHRGPPISPRASMGQGSHPREEYCCVCSFQDYSPPISGNFTIPNAHGKEPKGLTKSRDFCFCGCNPQTLRRARHPAFMLTRCAWSNSQIRMDFASPIPSCLPCPCYQQILWQKHSWVSLPYSPQAGSRRQGLAKAQKELKTCWGSAASWLGCERPALRWERDLNPARAPVDVKIQRDP